MSNVSPKKKKQKTSLIYIGSKKKPFVFRLSLKYSVCPRIFLQVLFFTNPTSPKKKKKKKLINLNKHIKNFFDLSGKWLSKRTKDKECCSNPPATLFRLTLSPRYKQIPQLGSSHPIVCRKKKNANWIIIFVSNLFFSSSSQDTNLRFIFW